jgi:hypothetical protein
MTAGEMRIIWAGMGDSYNAHARPYHEMSNLLAGTKPPDNPYAPNANIPRVHWQQPDYEGFMLNMLNAYEAAPVGGAFGGTRDSGNIFAAMLRRAKAPASNAPAGNGGWGNGGEVQPSPSPPAQASRAEAQRRREDIRPDVQAQHPAFAREPPQQPRNPAANHPGYTPDPPRRDDDGTGGDDWVDPHG